MKKNTLMDQVFIHSNISPSFSRFSPFKLWENRSLQSYTIILNPFGIQFHITADALKATSPLTTTLGEQCLPLSTIYTHLQRGSYHEII